MSDASGMRLKVKTEELVTAASEVQTRIDAMRRLFDTAGDIVRKSSSYWEGSGQTAYLRAYQTKYDSVENALRFFESHVRNLQTMAGVYEAAEAAASAAVETLQEDVIV